MIPALRSEERGALLYCSWSLMIAAFVFSPAVGAMIVTKVLTPMDLGPGVIARTAFGRLRVPEVVIKRDPFVPQGEALPGGAAVTAVILGSALEHC